MENSDYTDDVTLPPVNSEREKEMSFDRSLTGLIRSLYGKLRSDPKVIRITRIVAVILASVSVLLLIFYFILYLAPALKELPGVQVTEITNDEALKKDPVYRKQISQLNRDIQRLSRKYNSYTSGQSYIVINTTDNRFFLYRNKKLIREGFCSSGSYTMLQTEGGMKWIFKTPKGKYRIQGKTTNPVWKKPDWAFVEEGLPVPSKDHHSRFEYGVLGDYALSIGDGYLIHGTLYKRFMGMPVTHGCVRLADDDLETIFNTLSIGSKVYIF
jgi:lipoprotein-anchoring transpeptidase ErfK/SrfK/phage shock protein PspC (stress-responsive transcriptional regulator)